MKYPIQARFLVIFMVESLLYFLPPPKGKNRKQDRPDKSCILGPALSAFSLLFLYTQNHPFHIIPKSYYCLLHSKLYEYSQHQMRQAGTVTLISLVQNEKYYTVPPDAQDFYCSSICTLFLVLLLGL